MNKNLVLYHGSNCTDGMMSATLMYLYFKEIGEIQKTEFIAVNYNEPFPNVTGRHVYIVDFSYSKMVLEDVSKSAKSITMLDHHLTAAQQWNGYKRFIHQCKDGCPIKINLKEEKSGAGLTFDWILGELENKHAINSKFFFDGRVYEVTQAVQDRDLWLFKLDKTKEIYEALNIIPRTFEAWEDFLVTSPYEDYQEKVKAAGYYLEVKEKLAQDYASKYQLINFLSYTVPIVNCPASSASRVCEILNENYPFSVSYCLSLTEIFVSLRSNSETGIDVSEIAKNFKGGGHRAASGFKLSTNYINQFLNGQLEFVVKQINLEGYNQSS